jgi:hypothetical protein
LGITLNETITPAIILSLPFYQSRTDEAAFLADELVAASLAGRAAYYVALPAVGARKTSEVGLRRNIDTAAAALEHPLFTDTLLYIIKQII